jgi:site-specific DNA recombinase
MTGYIVKKKNLWYYKCTVKGCKHNVYAKMVNNAFEEILDRFTIKPEIMTYISQHLYSQLSSDIEEVENKNITLKTNLTTWIYE